MMADHLLAAIRAVDPEVTSDEVADIVWLSRQMSGVAHEPPPLTGEPRPSAAATGSPERLEPDRTGHDEPLPPAAKPDDRAAPTQARQDRQPTMSENSAALRLPRHGSLTEDPGVWTRSPGVPAIPSKLDMCRALRPFHRRLPSTTQTQPDEAATADWIAETGLWIPSTMPVSERWLDAALVVDDSASMAVWSRTVRELQGLLQQTGSFRDVRVWHMDGDLRRSAQVSVSGAVRNDIVRRDPREVIDPTGRRLILVASDCVGKAWANGSANAALAAWASSGPTAVVQMLPQRLWVDCAPRFAAVRIRSSLPGIPNSRLHVESRHGDVDPATDGIPVPVLQLEARWLRPWSSIVAGATGRWTNSVALFTGLTGDAASDQPVEEPAPEQSVSPRERLRRFRAHASPEAYQLSVCLAAAPLSLPVMRLVQGAILPASKPSHLAEVFLSGLLRRMGSDDDGVGADDIEYDFRQGVRVELLGELARHDALRILSRVSSFVSDRLGSPLDFLALLTTDRPRPPVPELSPPFARVAYQVLRSLGGRYGEAADRLSPMSSEFSTWDDSGRVADQATSATRYKDPPKLAPDQGDQMTSVIPTIAPERDRRREVLPEIMRGVPPRNPHFTGRQDLLYNLREQLLDSSETTALVPHALHGLGGVGKTQLAVEYVYRFAGEYDLIWWIPAEDSTQVRASFAELGAAMRLLDSPDVDRTVGAVLDTLRTGRNYRHWLLIFDNADRPADLAPYLPYPSGHVLITSRNTEWSEVARTVEVDVLDRQESISLLRERVPDISNIDADKLADRLGDLPLALEQAAAWQATTGMTVTEYLGLFESQFEQLTDAPPTGYPASVGATYRVALDRLRERAPSAAQLLEICAFLGPVPIPGAMLREGRHVALPSPLDQTFQDEVMFRRSVREIGRYALAKVDSAKDLVTVHRLVQLVVRAQLNDEERARTRRATQQILELWNPGYPDNARNWERHAELSPHIVPSGLISARDTEIRRVVLDQIRYRWVRGDYQSSKELAEETIRIWSEIWDDDEELMLIAHRDLANALRTLGDLDLARKIAQDTWERMRRIFGDEHEHTLYTTDSVSWDLRISGNFREAKRLDEQNLARCREVLDENDPFTLKVVHNLATDLRWLGDFEGARRADEDSIRRRRSVYGNEDRSTLLAISGFARDLYGLGEYADGLAMQESALGPQRGILGDLHSEVLLETRNLVILLRKTGHYARARNMAEELFDTYEQHFGSQHEQTLAAMLSLSNALRATEELDDSLRLGHDALGRYQSIFGEDHPVTLACAANLAITMRHAQDAEGALELNTRTLDGFEHVLGPDHPFTLCCATNLCNDLSELLRHEAARERSEDILRRSREVRGDDHPYTLACMLNTGLDRQATGDESAAALLEAAIAGFVAKLGRHHPETSAAAAHRRADCDIEPPET
jgi:hypothetical protein